ncbi:hypothetical protein HZC33_02195 [Candidatus Wolfebacteria bacterium]|nr:hypothetical protein [Candidatus Wolfebacteria bacterium]
MFKKAQIIIGKLSYYGIENAILIKPKMGKSVDLLKLIRRCLKKMNGKPVAIIQNLLDMKFEINADKKDKKAWILRYRELSYFWESWVEKKQKNEYLFQLSFVDRLHEFLMLANGRELIVKITNNVFTIISAPSPVYFNPKKRKNFWESMKNLPLSKKFAQKLCGANSEKQCIFCKAIGAPKLKLKDFLNGKGYKRIYYFCDKFNRFPDINAFQNALSKKLRDNENPFIGGCMINLPELARQWNKNPRKYFIRKL